MLSSRQKRKEYKMSEHTPAPWGFGNGREGERLILGDNGNGNYVAHVQIHQTPRAMGMLDEEEREANARLIKAAPDMLEALRFAAGDIRDGYPNEACAVLEHLEEAIAKAEGKDA